MTGGRPTQPEDRIIGSDHFWTIGGSRAPASHETPGRHQFAGGLQMPPPGRAEKRRRSPGIGGSRAPAPGLDRERRWFLPETRSDMAASVDSIHRARDFAHSKALA